MAQLWPLPAADENTVQMTPPTPALPQTLLPTLSMPTRSQALAGIPTPNDVAAPFDYKARLSELAAECRQMEKQLPIPATLQHPLQNQNTTIHAPPLDGNLPPATAAQQNNYKTRLTELNNECQQLPRLATRMTALIHPLCPKTTNDHLASSDETLYPSGVVESTAFNAHVAIAIQTQTHCTILSLLLELQVLTI